MPPKITPKNLHYDTTLPPFLQKLQSNYTQGLESRDGRHESALLRSRPKRVRDEGEEAEDAPVYVDEEGNVVDAGILLGNGGEVEKGGNGEGNEVEDEKTEKGEVETVKAKEKEKIAEIGGTKKRKIGRIIGSPKEGENGDKKGKNDVKVTERDSSDPKTTTTNLKTSTPGPKSKKKKISDKNKVKLSFGDDE